MGHGFAIQSMVDKGEKLCARDSWHGQCWEAEGAVTEKVLQGPEQGGCSEFAKNGLQCPLLINSFCLRQPPSPAGASLHGV